METRMDDRLLGRMLNNPQAKSIKDRTPYYVVGMPTAAAQMVMEFHRSFIRTWGRMPGDEDPQFWDTRNPDKLKPLPTLNSFITSLATAMERSNHHPAHIHAVKTTKTIIFGCGNCLDDCPRCNFRYVPEGWTKAWKKAIEDAPDDWTSKLVAPDPTAIKAVQASKYRG